MESDTVAVVGAGPSGLAALKNLKAKGIPCVAYEAHQGLGGIWNRENPRSSVHRETHTITSREVTAFADFPLDHGMPTYPRHDEILAYLESYAEHFDLNPSIRFNETVDSLVRDATGSWRITTDVGTEATHTAVVIANGHNWSPRMPDFSGSFSGKILHSCDYDSASEFEGQRVLIVGAGNSGCDIAAQCAQVATKVSLSMRRGYTFYPKFLLGVPSDKMGGFVRSLRLPPRLTTRLLRTMIRATVGNQQALGLPQPDHKPLESPPIINSLVPYYVAHGRIDVQPEVERLGGHTVHFTDGTSSDFDVIVASTGFRVDIPFIGKDYLDWGTHRPAFYLFAFSPTYDNLFIAGMTDGSGGHFPTVDLQSQLIASYISAKSGSRPSDAIREFDRRRKTNEIDLTGGIEFLDIPRNATQFSLRTFVEALNEHLALLEGKAATPAKPRSRWEILRSASRELRP